MLIDKSWSLQSAFTAINDTYRPGSEMTGSSRNRSIEAWGQLVGKTRAIIELDALLKECGSLNKMSKSVRMSSSSIKKLRQFFESLPDEIVALESPDKFTFSEGLPCNMEEDLTHEFKEIKGQNPTKSIQNLVDEYIIAFLNSSGGSIFWGISDDGIVKSVELDLTQKDNIKKAINSKINTLEPAIDPTRITVKFHRVIEFKNNYVLEVKVPKSNTTKLFFNSSGNTWIRVNGCKQKLQGMALQDYIIERIQKVSLNT